MLSIGSVELQYETPVGALVRGAVNGFVSSGSAGNYGDTTEHHQGPSDAMERVRPSDVGLQSAGGSE
ncbi:hypothetical protein U1Q18_048760, partial [Sarracenia purpurea var. burkii]